MVSRSDKVAERIKRDVVDIIQRDVKDPRIDTLISVTDVEVSRDLSFATIYISKLGTTKERKEVLSSLNKAASFIRTQLSKKLNTRSVPTITFKLDDSLIYGAKIEGILNDISNSSN